jgi:hypothetical protein
MEERKGKRGRNGEGERIIDGLEGDREEVGRGRRRREKGEEEKEKREGMGRKRKLIKIKFRDTKARWG